MYIKVNNPNSDLITSKVGEKNEFSALKCGVSKS